MTLDTNRSSASAALSPAFSKRCQVLAMTLLLGFQPIATDLYLPALPALAQDLGATPGAAQLTLSVLILAFGFAQLFWGPVADRVGRRPVLLLGAGLYIAAAVAGALAQSLSTLVVWRGIQGVGIAATVVCARAMVRDLYGPTEGTRVMSMALSGMGLIVILSPVVGGWVAWAWGWRATLHLTAAWGAATTVFLFLKVPETNRPNHARAGPLLDSPGSPGAPASTGMRHLAHQCRQVLLHPAFVAWSLLLACSYGGLFVLLSGSSFVFINVLGLDAKTYGTLMAVNAGFYLAGTFACRRLVSRFGVRGAVLRGALITLTSGLCFLALDLWGLRNMWALLLPQCLYVFGHGINQPCAQTAAVGPFPHSAGLAAALAGFVMAVTAFGTGWALGQAMDGSTRPYVWGVALWALGCCAVAWTLVRRNGQAGLSAQAA